jgi:hypothetical protein
MILDGITIISGSANANIVCSNVTYATRTALTNLEVGEIVYQNDTYNNSTPGIYIYTGTGWFQIGNKTGPATLSQYQITDAYTKTETTTLLTSKADLVNGTVPTSQLPSSLLGQLTYKGMHDMTLSLPAASAGNIGNFYIASNSAPNNGYSYGDWAISNGTTWDTLTWVFGVNSVNAKTGNVSLTKSDIGLSNVDNTSDNDKPISSATTDAFLLKANLTGAAFTGPITTNNTICGANNTELSFLSGVTASIQGQLNSKLSNNNPSISGAVTINGSVTANNYTDSKGSIRTVPQNLQTVAYTLLSTDTGKHVATGHNVTVPSGVFGIGDTVLLVNTGSEVITVDCSAITGYIAGSNTAKQSVSVPAKGMCTILFYTPTSAILTGSIF